MFTGGVFDPEPEWCLPLSFTMLLFTMLLLGLSDLEADSCDRSHKAGVYNTNQSEAFGSFAVCSLFFSLPSL